MPIIATRKAPRSSFDKSSQLLFRPSQLRVSPLSKALSALSEALPALSPRLFQFPCRSFQLPQSFPAPSEALARLLELLPAPIRGPPSSL